MGATTGPVWAGYDQFIKNVRAVIGRCSRDLTGPARCAVISRPWLSLTAMDLRSGGALVVLARAAPARRDALPWSAVAADAVSDSAGEPRGDLLDEPGIAVGIGEGATVLLIDHRRGDD